MREEGSIELVLLLAFLMALHLGLWLFSRSMSQKMTEAYAPLDSGAEGRSLEETEFSAWARVFSAPPPRIDFAAYNQQDKDAEALCYIVSRYGCAATGINFRCN
jgi:hypothetical protein